MLTEQNGCRSIDHYEQEKASLGAKSVAWRSARTIDFAPKRKRFLKQTLRLLGSLGFAILIAAGPSACDQNSATEATNGAGGAAAPANPVDLLIKEHEKVTNEYVRVAKKVKQGDVSLTVRYIELEQRTRDGSAKLQQASPKMTPEQAHRVATIKAKAAPYLQP